MNTGSVYPWVGLGRIAWVGFNDTVMGWVQRLCGVRTVGGRRGYLREFVFYTTNVKWTKETEPELLAPAFKNSVEESIRMTEDMDKWRKYVPSSMVWPTRIEDG